MPIADRVRRHAVSALLSLAVVLLERVQLGIRRASDWLFQLGEGLDGRLSNWGRMRRAAGQVHGVVRDLRVAGNVQGHFLVCLVRREHGGASVLRSVAAVQARASHCQW